MMRKTDVAVEISTGMLNDTVAVSGEVWKVCCATAPGTVTPSCCNVMMRLSGKLTPEAGAKFPWNANV